jgi:hypothetical protein
LVGSALQEHETRDFYRQMVGESILSQLVARVGL